MNIILRRRKLGRTSTREISNNIDPDLGVVPIRNDLLNKRVKTPVEWLIRWGCASKCDAQHTVNKAEAIALANHKAETRRILGELKLKKPIVPRTWNSWQGWYDDGEHLPVIVRPAHHAQGRSLEYCTTKEQVLQACVKYAFPGFYVTEYIKKEKEYRVFVMQGKVVWVAEKTPENPQAIAWNVAKGGRFDNVRWDDWPLRACRIAIQATEALGLDFGGVDIMQKGKEFLILEVNSAPSQTSPYRQQCTGKAFEYLIKSNNKKLETPEKVNSYKQFIHPGVVNV